MQVQETLMATLPNCSCVVWLPWAQPMALFGAIHSTASSMLTLVLQSCAVL